MQIDGSDHRWFEDRAPACTLLVYVDDATGRLMQLLFVPTESTQAYFAATRAYIERHGKPQAFYSDKASTFRINARENAEGRGYTQFGRALFELNIDILCANTSQAKGRVERMNGTLQDRLVKELRLRGISSMAAANAFALTFVADFNARFAKLPRSDFDAHRPLRGDEDLERIFSWREWRKVSQSLTLQYDKVMYLLEDLPAHRQLIHRYIEVAECPDGWVELWADGASLPYTTGRAARISQISFLFKTKVCGVLRFALETARRPRGHLTVITLLPSAGTQECLAPRRHRREGSVRARWAVRSVVRTRLGAGWWPPRASTSACQGHRACSGRALRPCRVS